MKKTYDPITIEQKWYQFWEDNNHFKAASNLDKSYCIMIPPPNVTGTLHMGHAFQDTLMDGLIRFHRMKGNNTLWQAGTDHAGIATQMVVERQLEKEGTDRHEIGREAFVKKVWQWKEQSGDTITNQLRRMGSSLDWSRERFTLDEGLSKAVNQVFISLYEEGLIYRGKRLVNWDPVLHTAVSDLEVISEEENGFMWHIKYPLKNKSGHLIVATTRPETMLGDSAVAVNPEDSRYQHLIGEKIILPITNREISIIADDYVDSTFGTGCVKITPAHDFNDYEMGKRHDLPIINIFTENAQINSNAPNEYIGLDRFDARSKIVEHLKKENLLEKTNDHKLVVPRGDRSGSIIEPFLTDQWYVKVAPLAGPAIEAVENGEIKFVPDNWKNTYFEWMRNIQDWCISRQIWWGHRIPAWYDEQGNVYVGSSETDIRKKNNLGNDISLKQESDVLDTWFSSALWPFSTLGWPEKTAEFEKFYPTNVLVTGFDIIFFWVARMIMMGIKFTGKIPFHEVYIHGLVRDSHGNKMSKSKGNVLDPIDLIDGIELEALISKRTQGLMQPNMAKKIKRATEKEFPGGIQAYGTDALRFTFAALASTGRDIKFELSRIEGYRNFCNKLWNAARFVLMNSDPDRHNYEPPDKNNTLINQWIISKLNITTQQVTDAINIYRFDLAAQAIYEFTWNEYCDWYLELSKPILTDDSHEKDAQSETRYTLIYVLESILKLAHPIIPFITEEIWQLTAPLLGKKGKTIMLEPYPEFDQRLVNPSAITEVQWIMDFILGIRKIRSGMNLSPKKRLPVFLENGTGDDLKMLETNRPFLLTLAKLEEITWLKEKEEAPESATALIGKMKILIPMSGLIDKSAELDRLSKELDKLHKELLMREKKLSNSKFVAQAPKNVVDKEKKRLVDIKISVNELNNQRNQIQSM